MILGDYPSFILSIFGL